MCFCLRGWPLRWPAKLHADKGYDHARYRAHLKRRGIKERIARKGIERNGRLARHRWGGRMHARFGWPPSATYAVALAELVNAQFHHHFVEHWGDSTTSLSDGQNFRAGSKAESTGHVNPKYGSSPRRTLYIHTDQYAPFHTKIVRDSTYALDGLLYHESDLRIEEEHYTDMAGFADHVFALMYLLGFRFAPRIRDLDDTNLYIPKGEAAYDALKPMIGGTFNIKHVRPHWDEILRLCVTGQRGMFRHRSFLVVASGHRDI